MFYYISTFTFPPCIVRNIAVRARLQPDSFHLYRWPWTVHNFDLLFIKLVFHTGHFSVEACKIRKRLTTAKKRMIWTWNNHTSNVSSCFINFSLLNLWGPIIWATSSNNDQLLISCSSLSRCNQGLDINSLVWHLVPSLHLT